MKHYGTIIKDFISFERMRYGLLLKCAWAWAVQARVTSWKRGIRVGKNSRVKPAQAWVVQGWVTSWQEGHWGEKN